MGLVSGEFFRFLPVSMKIVQVVVFVWQSLQILVGKRAVLFCFVFSFSGVPFIREEEMGIWPIG